MKKPKSILIDTEHTEIVPPPPKADDTPDGRRNSNVAGEDQEAAPPPTAVAIMDIVLPPTHANDENLLGNGFLRRGQGGMLAGPTGIGKSVFGLQAALWWACGRAFLGIRPQRALKILIVQSENDDADMTEMRDGIVVESNCTPEEIAAMRTNVWMARSFNKGSAMLAEAGKLIEGRGFDLVIIDPLFAYAGCDLAKDQTGVSDFLRCEVQPWAIKHRLGVVFIHHTNKPPMAKPGAAEPKAGDFAYLGSGHNELANWPRFVAVLRSLGSRKVFEFRIGKRWRRAGICDEAGNAIDHVLIKHVDNGICWQTATIAELKQSQAADGMSEGRGHAGKILAAFREKSRDGSVALAVVADAAGFSEKTIRRAFDDAGEIIRLDGLALRISKGKVVTVEEETNEPF